MGMKAHAERRRHPRQALAAGVQFFHAASQREFPGRCVDVSQGGVLMYVPPTAPVQAGQTIRLNLTGGPRPEWPLPDHGGVEATIVRVDRQTLLSQGHLAVGVRFTG